MKKEDTEFYKKCQLYYNKIRDLTRKQKGIEVEKIIQEIEGSIRLWEEQVKTSRKRVNSLRALLVKAAAEERKLVKTSEKHQRQQIIDIEEKRRQQNGK